VKGRILQERVEVAEDLRTQLVKLAGRGRDTKVVVVAHSQGTILASEMVRQLRQLNAPILERMEVFNFAFCADEFPENCCRRVEHFANENDFVAALSLAGNPYNVPGAIYRRAGAWGHFLGAHYLDGLTAGAYRTEDGDHGSLLYRYIGGANYGAWL
jgi:predicted alpha/beta hydrolase family esterase